jgi:hypothetical protein
VFVVVLPHSSTHPKAAKNHSKRNNKTQQTHDLESKQGEFSVEHSHS